MSRINAWNMHFCTSAPNTTHLKLSSRQAMLSAGDWTDAQMTHTDSKWVKEAIKKRSHSQIPPEIWRNNVHA